MLVVLENFYTSATGQQHNPSTGKNPRGDRVRMSIAETIRSLGVSWIRVVNPYRWMTYEDAIRVADLKTRAGRFERIRGEHGAADGRVLRVTDYLKPDLDEIYGILPAAIGAPIARLCERWWPERRPSLGQRVRTTSVLGFLRVWLLGRLRFLRPMSLRAQREIALIDRWQQAVLECAALDYDVGCEVADIATVVRGYGDVRRRLSAAFARFLDEILAPVLARSREVDRGYARAREVVRETRQKLQEDETGIEAAVLSASRA